MHQSALERRVERLLKEVEKPRLLSELEAYALAHQIELVACIRDLLRYIAGTRTATVTLTVKATRLLDAVSPLLTPPHGRPVGFVDEAIRGLSVDLAPAASELRRFLEDDFTLHHDPKEADDVPNRSR
jgi:hypothetical protein